MVRPPCCEKAGIKKGPWTPEEDIILVSYIQEHGPGNWRSVPTNTGLLRCSKSCRLRWTNYLRPGIKRGNFTPHEEGMIIHLQALLGNKWAAIASYLPQRTDNDIKNYWNTHLKKKLKKFQMASDHHNSTSYNNHHFVPKNEYNNERVFDNSKPRYNSSLITTDPNSSVYASSAENISRLLEGWMRTSPFQPNTHDKTYRDISAECDTTAAAAAAAAYVPASIQCYKPEIENDEGINGMINHSDELQCILSYNHNLNSMEREKSVSCDSSHKGSENSGLIDQEKLHFMHEEKPKTETNPPLSFLEKWLLEESCTQVEGVLELPSIF